MSHLNDPQVDALIATARATLKEEEQVNAYKDVQRYIAAQAHALLGMVNGEGYTLYQCPCADVADVVSGRTIWRLR